jgi:hypothetical protein
LVVPEAKAGDKVPASKANELNVASLDKAAATLKFTV